MGFYPKHLKVRRYRRVMRTIAMAALAGAMFERGTWSGVRDGYGWNLLFPDGERSHYHHTKYDAACRYLMWWFAKQDIWPVRKFA